MQRYVRRKVSAAAATAAPQPRPSNTITSTGMFPPSGRICLYMKTAERAHTPAKLWEKVKVCGCLPATRRHSRQLPRLHAGSLPLTPALFQRHAHARAHPGPHTPAWTHPQLSRNYAKALEQIDEHLAFWPQWLVHKNKQRLTKITQYLIRMRKLAKRAAPKLERVHTKVERRERIREAKALKAAKVDAAIEKELLERLKSGTYGDIYNFPAAQYEKALDALHEEEEEYSDQEESVAQAAGDQFVQGSDSDMEDWSEGDEFDMGDVDSDEDEEDSDEEADDEAGAAAARPAADGGSADPELAKVGKRSVRFGETAKPSQAAGRKKPRRSTAPRVEKEDVDALLGRARPQVMIEYEEEHEHAGAARAVDF